MRDRIEVPISLQQVFKVKTWIELHHILEDKMIELLADKIILFKDELDMTKIKEVQDQINELVPLQNFVLNMVNEDRNRAGTGLVQAKTLDPAMNIKQVH